VRQNKKPPDMHQFDNDESILTAICGSVAERNAALKHVYTDVQLRKMIYQMVVQYNGTPDDVQDVLQETIVIFDRNVRSGRFEAKSSVRTYCVAIAKWHWASVKRKKDNQTSELDDNRLHETTPGPETDYITEERKQVINKALADMGGRCQQLLQLYKLSYSMEEIAQEANLSSADMAKKEVHRCRERLRQYLMRQPELLSILRVL
jgi:RNA polymerase sigma factor (sigma-70 family)